MFVFFQIKAFSSLFNKTKYDNPIENTHETTPTSKILTIEASRYWESKKGIGKAERKIRILFSCTFTMYSLRLKLMSPLNVNNCIP